MNSFGYKDFSLDNDIFQCKFYLLVTVALDIFIKENNYVLYHPWISPLPFFYAKGVYLAKPSGELSYYPFLDPV